MEFFDKLGQKASKAYKVTADKTEKVAKDVKIKVKIQNLKGDIEDVYEELGKLVYENYLLDSNEDNTKIKEMIQDKCNKIDEISKQIDEMKLESLDLKNTKLCCNCSNKIDKDSRFCPLCGKIQNTSNQECKDENQIEFVELENVDNNKEETDSNEEIIEAFDTEEISNIEEV